MYIKSKAVIGGQHLLLVQLVQVRQRLGGAHHTSVLLKALPRSLPAARHARVPGVTGSSCWAA